MVSLIHFINGIYGNVVISALHVMAADPPIGTGSSLGSNSILISPSDSNFGQPEDKTKTLSKKKGVVVFQPSRTDKSAKHEAVSEI